MRYSELFGEDIQADIAAIKSELDEDGSTVFVYSGPGTLHAYIKNLHRKGRGLDDEYLCRFKVCYEKKDLYVSYYRDNAPEKLIGSMSELVGELDGESHCRVIVEVDDRVELAEIVQQLIYLEYPLETVDILLRCEESSVGQSRRFMERVGKLVENCDTAVLELSELQRQVEQEQLNSPTREVCLKDIEEALESCRLIREQITEAMSAELKLAVAASQKAERSSIVNCFLGEEIVPASEEPVASGNRVYTRSSDNRYSFRLEGDDAVSYYKSRSEIHSAIQQIFQEAEASWDTDFSVPDIYVQYVTGENNFSSYTIYDTAGPDAVGTDREELAMEAVRKCDAAVFAIDYIKLLASPEEEYLQDLQKVFASQDRFHILILALDRIDARYMDQDAPRSFIMPADLLKSHLAEIDESYRNCIVFPISSKEYFSVLEAEQAGVSELKNGISMDQMRRLSFSREDVPALKWLHGYSEYLDYYTGIAEISYDVFKKDSGMPALMNYVSYVIQSKARDGIINNIASQIDFQKGEIQNVLDVISNLESMIHADDEKIRQITEIITDYADSIEEIFTQDCNRNDMSVLKYNNLLGQMDGVCEKMIERQVEMLRSSCEVTIIADKIYHIVTAVICQRLCEKLQQNGWVTGREINALFTGTDFNKVVDAVIYEEAERNAESIFRQLTQLSQEMGQIVAYRQTKLAEANQKCRTALSKEEVEVQLPDLPTFTFSRQMVPQRDIPPDVYQVNLDLFHDLEFLFEKRFVSNIGIWFFGFLRFRKVAAEDYRLTLKASPEEFQMACDKYLRPDIVNSVYTCQIPDKIYKLLKSSIVDECTCGFLRELRERFNNLNAAYKACGAEFRTAVDDRDKYKANIALHEKRKGTIQKIKESTEAFLTAWDDVVNGSEAEYDRRT